MRALRNLIMQKPFDITLFRTEYFQLKFIGSNRRCWLLQRMLQPTGKRKSILVGNGRQEGPTSHFSF